MLVVQVLHLIYRVLKMTCDTTASAESEQSLQGIGSFPKYKITGAARSLRRTLSAVDMSSRSGLSPFKRIADELQIDQEVVEQKNDFPEQQEAGQLDIRSSVLIQDPSSLPPPYVHPLVRKSKSCLSLKSLEICTESLGSESGSEGYPPSDISLSDTDEEHQEIHEEQKAIQEVAVVMSYIKRSSSSSVIPRSFPPPLKSLSRPGGGIQMKTHRIDGRLVLKAISVPTSQNCFTTQRQDGRLVLTVTSPIQESNEEEEEKEADTGIVLEMTSNSVPKLQLTGVTLSCKNNNLESLINLGEVLPQSLPISAPTLSAGEPPPQVSTLPQQSVTAAAVEASSFNMYEYCWRKETSSVASDIGGLYHSLDQQSLFNTKNAHYNNNNNNLLTSSKNNYYINSNNLFLKDSTTTAKGGRDYKQEKQSGETVIEKLIIVPAYCKPAPRRKSLEIWVPHCIAATS